MKNKFLFSVFVYFIILALLSLGFWQIYRLNWKLELIKQIENRVRWRESVINMIENNVDHFIEIGPGKVLSGLVKRINRDVKIDTINNQSDIESLKI